MGFLQRILIQNCNATVGAAGLLKSGLIISTNATRHYYYSAAAKHYFLRQKHHNQSSLIKGFATKSPTQQSPLIKSVIFDFDGIVVDTETIFYTINSKVLAHFGAPYSLELKHGQMGMKLTEAVDYLLKHTGLAEKGVKSEEYLVLYKRLVDEMIYDCQMMPGARKLIEHLLANNVQLAICTGSASDEFPKKIGKCRDLVAKMNAVVLAGDDPEVRVGKPAPDAYLITMRRMQPPRDGEPERVLVFEDSINGVHSALSAGCQTVWCPQREFWMEEWEVLKQKFCGNPCFAETLDSLEHFQPEKYGLPAYPK